MATCKAERQGPAGQRGPMSGNERSCSSCSSENIRAATATTPTTHGQTVRTVVTAISTRPPNAHNRCSAISDQNFPLATRTRRRPGRPGGRSGRGGADHQPGPAAAGLPGMAGGALARLPGLAGRVLALGHRRQRSADLVGGAGGVGLRRCGRDRLPGPAAVLAARPRPPAPRRTADDRPPRKDAARGRRVSFDRPVSYGHGAGAYSSWSCRWLPRLKGSACRWPISPVSTLTFIPAFSVAPGRWSARLMMSTGRRLYARP